MHQNRLYEPGHGQGSSANDAREENVATELLVLDQRIVDDVENISKRTLRTALRAVLLQEQSSWNSTESNNRLGTERKP